MCVRVCVCLYKSLITLVFPAAKTGFKSVICILYQEETLIVIISDIGV